MAPDAPWWLHGLHPGFQHCFAFRDAGNGTTLIVNQVGTRMQCEVAPLGMADMVLDLTACGGRCVLLVIRTPAPAGPYLRGPMTCVETVKALLGIRAWWILTPRQLYRRLRREDAKWLHITKGN